MLSDDRSIDNLKQLFQEIRKYGEYQLEYAQLNLTEKLTKVIVLLILIIVCLVLGMMALFYFTFSLAYVLADCTGSMACGLAIVAVGVLVICALIYALRTPLIVRPLVKSLAKILLTKTDKEQ